MKLGAAQLLPEVKQRRPTPLSVAEAEAFLLGGLENENDATPTTPSSSSSSTATDLEASNFNGPIGKLESHPAEEADEADEEDRAEEEEEKEKANGLRCRHPSSVAIYDQPDENSHNSADAGYDVTCFSSACVDPASAAQVMDPHADFLQPVVLKRYGPGHDIQVYLSQQQQHFHQPSHPDEDNSELNVVIPVRGVHFSPVVSAVNWRESYLTVSDEEVEDEQKEDQQQQQQQQKKKKKTKEEEEEEEKEKEEAGANQEEEKEEEEVGRAPMLLPSVGDLPHDPVPLKVTPVAPKSATIAPPLAPLPAPIADVIVEEKAADGAKKEPIFQRFSLARISARMSATFSRSDSKRQSKKKNATDKIHPHPSPQPPQPPQHQSPPEAILPKDEKLNVSPFHLKPVSFVTVISLRYSSN